MQTFKNKIKRIFFFLPNRSHEVKQNKILACQHLFGTEVFIETGTYLGEMVNAVKNSFKEINSIELNPTLAEEAKKHFSKHKHINIHQGDSGIVLKDILSPMKKPVIFWLDGHYSAGITAKSQVFGDTPIRSELTIIFDCWKDQSVILVDDARCFDGTNGYPTLEEVKNFVLEKNPRLRFFVDNDIIVIF